MTKEMFVSSTPHETRVGLVEDDQLAEIYLERENEYTLAGSIYRGRVTRVLPGMQSAFVDIGLERDAPPRAERPDRPERHDRPERSERTDFGPPPGYQPMILPGESISKYSRLAQAQAAAPARAPSPTPSREIPAPPIAETFPEDEPLFAKPATEDRRQTTPPRSQAPTETKPATARREQKRFDEMNVAAIFGGGATESEEQSQEDDNEDAQ